MPYAAEEDELAARYPLHARPRRTAPCAPRSPSSCSPACAPRAGARRRRLSLRRLAPGRPRRAPRAGDTAAATAATASTAARTVTSTTPPTRSRRCATAGLIDYRPGLHVERIARTDGEVTVEASALDGGPGSQLQRRARLPRGGRAVEHRDPAALGAPCRERTAILDSQTLYLPFLWLGRVPARTGREPGHTLAQAFLVLENPAVCAHSVHISLYTYNDGLSDRARATQPRLASLLGPALEASPAGS